MEGDNDDDFFMPDPAEIAVARSALEAVRRQEQERRREHRVQAGAAQNPFDAPGRAPPDFGLRAAPASPPRVFPAQRRPRRNAHAAAPAGADVGQPAAEDANARGQALANDIDFVPAIADDAPPRAPSPQPAPQQMYNLADIPLDPPAPRAQPARAAVDQAVAAAARRALLDPAAPPPNAGGIAAAAAAAVAAVAADPGADGPVPLGPPIHYRALYSAARPERGLAVPQLCYLCDATMDTENAPKRTLLALANNMWYTYRLRIRVDILMVFISHAIFHQSRRVVCLSPLEVFHHCVHDMTDPVTDAIIISTDMRFARTTLSRRLMELDPAGEPVGVDAGRLSQLERVIRVTVATHAQLRCSGHGAGGGSVMSGPGTAR